MKFVQVLQKNAGHAALWLFMLILICQTLFPVQVYSMEPLSGETGQQPEPVTGIVTDTEGEPLIGVSIVLKSNPTVGVITDVNGRFSIQAASGDVLIFSYVGMETREIPVTDRQTLSVTMEPRSTALEEVMVVAYGTATKESFTGSASVVRSDKLETRPVSSFTAALASNTTGLMVNTSGMPGRTDVVRIRGTGSVNADLSPLYVIDGIVANMTDITQLSSANSNPMATLNPSDIESVTILKDAAASSLYGSRAANGVIVITTKQGKEGKTRYNLDVQYGLANGLYSKPMANKDQFAELWVTGELHRLMNIDAIFTGLNSIDYIKNCYDNENTYNYYLNRARSNFNTAYAIHGNVYDFWGEGYDQYPDTDWYEVVSRTGSTQKVNLSASGGQNGLTFFTSGEYFNQVGTIIGSDYSRYSGRLNLTSKTNKVAWFGMNMNMSYIDQNGPLLGNLYANPLRAAANIPPVVPVYYEGEPNLALPGDILNNYNPVAMMDMNIYNYYTYRNMANAWGQLNFTDDLFLKSTLGYDNRVQYDIRWENKDIGTGAGYDGRRQDIQTRRRRLTSSTILNYEKRFAEKHNLAVLAGWEAEWTHTDLLGATSTGYATNLTPILSSGTIPTEAVGRTYDDALLSAISRINYNYRNRYYAQVSYRADGSSRFGPESRWGHFYSVSGSWRVTEEPFFRVSWINDAKIRAGYGINGTVPSGLYEYLGNYTMGYDYYNLPGARVTNVANMNLSWETSYNVNVGIDLRMLNSRLNTSFEYYNRHSKELLFDREISRTTGFTNATVNMGSMKNSGFEFSVEAFLIRNSNMSWSMDVNLSYLKNLITDLPNDNVGPTNIDRKGYSEGSLYLPEYAGVDQETGAPMWWHVDEASGEKTLTYDYSEATRQIIGTREPKYFGGFSTRFTWKNFEVETLFSYAWDFYALDYCASRYTQTDGGQSYLNAETSQLDSWTPWNTNAANPIRINGVTNGSQFSTRHAYNGAYLKMKNIRIGYQLPPKIASRIKMASCRLFVQGENLFVLTEMPNFDPEIRVNSYRYVYDFPPPQTFTVGINLGF